MKLTKDDIIDGGYWNDCSDKQEIPAIRLDKLNEVIKELREIIEVWEGSPSYGVLGDEEWTIHESVLILQIALESAIKKHIKARQKQTDKVFTFKEGLDTFQNACRSCGLEYKIQIREGKIRGTITSPKWNKKSEDSLK